MKSLFYVALVTPYLWGASLSAQDQASDASDPDRRVARAQFTTEIVDREPADRVLVLSPPVEEVFFFTDLRRMDGETVTHSWHYQGELVSRMSFEVGGPRWRVYSKVLLEPHQIGEWSVIVTDSSDWPLYTELFRYQAAENVQMLE